jgi:hypothetical protein
MKEKISCENCKKVFISNYLLDKHQNRKEPCLFEILENVKNKIEILNLTVKNNDNKSIQSKSCICVYCKDTYSNKSNLKKHINKNCDKRNQYIIKLELLNTELSYINNKINIYNKNKDTTVYNEINTENENDKDIKLDNSGNSGNSGNLKVNIANFNKDDLIKILEQIQSNNKNIQPQSNQIMTNSTNNSNNNNTNNTNNTTNNIENQQNITNNIQITLNNYDQPNCDFLTIDQKNRFLKDRYKGLLDFITYVYFNEAYPENHTILYTNLRSKYGQIYKNNKWMIEEIDQIADKLNEYSFDKLSEHLDEIKNDENAEQYKKEIDKGLAFVKHFSANDTSKQSKTDIKKTLYNNKDLIEKTKKKKKQ